MSLAAYASEIIKLFRNGTLSLNELGKAYT